MKWTQTEITEAIYMIKNGSDYNEIGLNLNRTPNSVRHKLNEYGLNLSQFINREEKYCLNCDKLLIKKGNIFCSSSCSATHNNKKRGVKIKCSFCDKITTNYKFCSKKCSTDFKKNKTFKKIQDGDVTLGIKRYKEYLIKVYGEKCMICGWNEINPTTGNVPIELEHVDGNSDNNKLDNLKLLCPNHHSLTHTYGSLNKGNGRTIRKEKRKVYRTK